MKCPGPQVIQTWANTGTSHIPPLWLQIHVPAMKHLMQHPAPQCRKSLWDWRCPSSKDVQIVKHKRQLFCIGAKRFHVACFNFTWLLGCNPWQSCCHFLQRLQRTSCPVLKLVQLNRGSCLYHKKGASPFPVTPPRPLSGLLIAWCEVSWTHLLVQMRTNPSTKTKI